MKLDLQFVEPPTGERLVVIPETQYRLLEKAAAEGFTAMRKAPACSIPEAVKKRISDGESPVRAIRTWRDLAGDTWRGWLG